MRLSSCSLPISSFTAALANASSPEEKQEHKSMSIKDQKGRNVIFSGPQGVVYATDSNEDDGRV